MEQLKFQVHKCLWTGMYHTILLGGEFANCHGQGITPEMVIISLKLTVNARRRAQARAQAGRQTEPICQ